MRKLLSKTNATDGLAEAIAIDLAICADDPDRYILRRMAAHMTPKDAQATKSMVRAVGGYVRNAFLTTDLESKEWFLTVARVLHELHLFPFGGFQVAVRPGQVLPKPGLLGGSASRVDRALRSLPIRRMAICGICGKPFFRTGRRKYCPPPGLCSNQAQRDSKLLSWKKHGRKWRKTVGRKKRA